MSRESHISDNDALSVPSPDSQHLDADLNEDPGEPSLAIDHLDDLQPAPMIEDGEFEKGYGEKLDQVLDLDLWSDGRDLNAIFDKLDEEVCQALIQEDAQSVEVRKRLFPLIATRASAPKGAGVFQATRKQLEQTQLNVLFNGGVEACDGTCAVHDTLPLTITQIGICLVSYQGQQGAWGHRLFRRDLRIRGQDPLDEALLDLLQRREQRRS